MLSFVDGLWECIPHPRVMGWNPGLQSVCVERGGVYNRGGLRVIKPLGTLPQKGLTAALIELVPVKMGLIRAKTPHACGLSCMCLFPFSLPSCCDTTKGVFTGGQTDEASQPWICSI